MQNQLHYFGLYTAWVGSLGYGFLFVIGPITTALCEHFGCRVMSCAGSVLTTFSLLVTSFAPSLSSMYFTFGVLWGTGGSFLFFSGLLILRFYFNRNISLANGITMTGAGFGTLVFNVILQELDDKYGWRGGMRVLSVFASLTFLCGCAYIPPPVDYLPFERPSLWFRLKRLIDPRPWKDRAFTMWVVSLSFILFAYFFPYTYLVSTSQWLLHFLYSLCSWRNFASQAARGLIRSRVGNFTQGFVSRSRGACTRKIHSCPLMTLILPATQAISYTTKRYPNICDSNNG